MRPASGSGTFSEESTELLTWNQAELLRNCWFGHQECSTDAAVALMGSRWATEEPEIRNHAHVRG